MNKTLCPGRLIQGMLFALCLAFALSAVAAVTADPASVVFQNAATPATIKIIADDAPVPAADIHGFRLMVNQSDYGHMFQFTKAEGAVTLTPSKTIEVGSYDLVITTAKGNVVVKVYTPLSDQQSSLDALAKKLNISLDELKRKSGMTREFARQQVSLSLEPVYYAGSTLTLEIPVPAGAKTTWSVNGEQVAENAPLSYTFKNPGTYLVAYKEMQGEIVTASTAEMVEAVYEPEIPTEVGAGVKLTLESPGGYARYSWTVDGKMTSADAKLPVLYDAPGAHRIELLAESPAAGPKEAFRRLVYVLTVTPSKKP